MEKENSFKNILLHVPHSSSAFPEDSDYSFQNLNDSERLLIDYYTDELFAPDEKTDRVYSVVFPYCRLYCDVERLVNDPLEKEGLGIRYIRKDHGNDYVFRFFSSAIDSFNLYSDFHSFVSKKLYSMGEDTLLIDCHSFSALPNMLNSNPPDIDICIGYNDDDTCPNRSTINYIANYFESFGYKIGINEPFSNSKTFSVPMKYHSIMIELNKRLYMDEETLEKKVDFVRIQKIIQSLYMFIIGGYENER